MSEDDVEHYVRQLREAILLGLQHPNDEVRARVSDLVLDMSVKVVGEQG